MSKLFFVYELAAKQEDGTPFTIANRFTWTLDDRSNFYAMVSAITGIKLVNGQEIDISTLLAKPCMVMIVAKPSRENKVYHNIETVNQYPLGMPLPAFVLEPVLWSVMERTEFPDRPWFPWIFGEQIHNYAAASKEGLAFMVPKDTPGQSAPAATSSSATAVPASSATPTDSQSAPPAEIVPIIAKCPGLTWPWMPETLLKYQDELPPREWNALSAVAVPF